MRKVLLVLAGLSLLATSSDVSNGFKSIQWQKVELQEKISNKVKKTVGSLLEKEDYLVEVDISYYAPPKPNFEKDTKPEVKISEKEFKDSSRDYIVFSKLGLEVPTVANNRKSEQKKLNDVWKFHEANNIFNNLEAVTIFIYLEKSIKDSTVDSLKALLNNLKLPIGDITAEVEIEKIPFKANRVGKAVPKKAEQKLSEYVLENLAKFSTMLGLVLSSIIFMLGALFLFRRYRKFKENEKAKEMISNASNSMKEEEKEKERQEQMAAAAPGGGDGFGDDTHLVGFSRFEKYMNNSPDEAIHMIKSWIIEKSDDSINALNALVKQLDNEVLLKVFSNLGDEERNTWKVNLNENLTLDDIRRANEYISTQIVAEIIVPHVLRDYELLDTLLTLKPTEGVDFVNKHPEYRGVFMNIINPKFFAKIAERLDHETLANVIEESMSFEEFDKGSSYDNFKQSLESCRVIKKQRPFVKKIVDLIESATPKVEKSLYDALLAEKEFDTVTRLGKKHYPSFLLEDASNETLEQIIKNYPMKKRVSLLLLDNPVFNHKLIDIFAPEGSKARDFLDIEMQLAGENLEVQREIRENPEGVYFEFVQFARKIIENNSAVKELTNVQIEQWVESFAGTTETITPDIQEAA